MLTEIVPDLPIKAFPLQSYELERTDLFWKIGKGRNRLRLLIGLRDPGEANTLLPIIQCLEDHPCNIFAFADNRAKEALSASNLGFTRAKLSFDPLIRIAAIKADCVLTASATDPGTDLSLTLLAKYLKVPSIWLEDYPGGILAYYRQNKTIAVHPSILPDYMFVYNEWAAKEELKLAPELNPSNIIPTGIPAFDKIAAERKDETKTRLRNTFGIRPEEIIITYMGIPSPANPEALEVLVQALDETNPQNYRLVNRLHPRDTNSRTLYESITSPILNHLLDTSDFSSAETSMASDLVTTTYSSAGIEAVFRGIPTIHILIKDILAKSESGENVPIPPPVLDGSSLAVYDKSRMADILHMALSKPQSLLARMESWKVDGQASLRVANRVLKIALGHKLNKVS